MFDAVLAARQLDDIELADSTVVWGHSQGGGVALWVAQVVEQYESEVPLSGVAALAPASDVVGLVDSLMSMTGGSLFASYVLEGYVAAYPDVQRDDYVRGAAVPFVRSSSSRCLAFTEVLPSALGSIAAGLCDTGTQVEYRSYAGLDHIPLVEAESPLIADLLDWTDQRLAGAPAVGCDG